MEGSSDVMVEVTLQSAGDAFQVPCLDGKAP